MLYLIVFVIAVIVGVAAPKGLGFVFFIADCFLPDPFPFVDEVGIVIGAVVALQK